MWCYALNPSTQKTETGESLSLWPAWSTDGLSELPSLDNESRKQKADKNEIEWGGHVQAQTSSTTGQFWPCHSEFIIKDKRRTIWRIPPQLWKVMQDMFHRCPWVEAYGRYCIKLWIWSLHCLGDPNMLRMRELCDNAKESF